MSSFDCSFDDSNCDDIFIAIMNISNSISWNYTQIDGSLHCDTLSRNNVLHVHYITQHYFSFLFLKYS